MSSAGDARRWGLTSLAPHGAAAGRPLVLACLALLAAAAACGAGEGVRPASTGRTPSPAAAIATSVARPTVAIGDAAFYVEIADDPLRRARGLSGRDNLSPGDGMLFLFPDRPPSAFWMKDMRLALDIVWISSGCEVIGVARDVPPPAPGTPLAELPLYPAPEGTGYVLEIRGGEAAARHVAPGDAVRFTGVPGPPGQGCP